MTKEELARRFEAMGYTVSAVIPAQVIKHYDIISHAIGDRISIEEDLEDVLYAVNYKGMTDTGYLFNSILLWEFIRKEVGDVK